MKRYLSIAIALIGVIIAGVVGYYQIFYKPKPALNIEKVGETLLTRPLNIEGLNAVYTFHDSIEVKELWQTIFVIKNTGSKSILGDGFGEKNIRGNSIPILFNEDARVLSIVLSNHNNDAKLNNGSLYVSQWRPNEFVELTVISDGIEPPCLKINDREIVDVQVSYSEYSPTAEINDKKLIDYFPKGFAVLLKWIVVFIIIGMSVYSIITFRKQMKGINGIGIKIFTTFVWLILVALFAIPLLWMF